MIQKCRSSGRSRMLGAVHVLRSGSAGDRGAATVALPQVQHVEKIVKDTMSRPLSRADLSQIQYIGKVVVVPVVRRQQAPASSKHRNGEGSPCLRFDRVQMDQLGRNTSTYLPPGQHARGRKSRLSLYLDRVADEMMEPLTVTDLIEWQTCQWRCTTVEVPQSQWSRSCDRPEMNVLVQTPITDGCVVLRIRQDTPVV